MNPELRNTLNLARQVARKMEEAAEFPDLDAAAQWASDLKRLAAELEEQFEEERQK